MSVGNGMCLAVITGQKNPAHGGIFKIIQD